MRGNRRLHDLKQNTFREAKVGIKLNKDNGEYRKMTQLFHLRKLEE